MPAQVYAEAIFTRAVISGRRAYELAAHWKGDHDDGVPIFVLTHDVPDEPPPGSVRYVTDAGPARRRRYCGPRSSTSWNCMTCRCCSGRAGACTTTCPPNTSNST